MKLTIEINIHKDDYARITKWLKQFNPEATLKDTLQDFCIETQQRFKERADRYYKTGKTAYERFKEEIGVA